MTCPVSDIFDVRYGHSLELNALTQANMERGVAFVSRQMGNNGISAYVAPIDDLEPAPPGEITCALGGNGVLTTYVQRLSFIAGATSRSFVQGCRSLSRKRSITACA